MSQLRNQGSPSGKPRKSSKKRRGKHRRHRHHGQINFNSDASASGDIKHFTSKSATGIHQQKPTHQSSRDSTNNGKDFEFFICFGLFGLYLFLLVPILELTSLRLSNSFLPSACKAFLLLLGNFFSNF